MKNCYSCKHLDYYEKDSTESYDQSGYLCEKRSYRTGLDEADHLEQLRDPLYLKSPKRCCEPGKPIKPNTSEGV